PGTPSARVGGVKWARRRGGRRGRRRERRRGDEPLTFADTSRRAFEVAYWKTIVSLAHDKFRNKGSADCIQDPVTHAELPHHQRDLETLGDFLLGYHNRAIARAGLTGKAWAGE